MAKITKAELAKDLSDLASAGCYYYAITYNRVKYAALVVEDDSGRHEIVLPKHRATILCDMTKIPEDMSPGVYTIDVDIE